MSSTINSSEGQRWIRNGSRLSRTVKFFKKMHTCFIFVYVYVRGVSREFSLRFFFSFFFNFAFLLCSSKKNADVLPVLNVLYCV